MVLDFSIRMFDSGYGEDKKKGLYYCRSLINSVEDKRCPTAIQIDRFSFLGETSFFSEYFSNNIKEFREIRKIFNDRSSAIGKTGISSRIINHWFAKSILPQGVSSSEGNWKKFTLIELVWMRAVDYMREYGLSLDKIAKVRYWVLQWDKKNDSYPWFEFYVALARFSALDPYIIVLPDGTAELATSLDIEIYKNNHSDFKSHLLFISFKSLLRELGFDAKKIERLESLAEEEKVVRKAILQGNKSINLKIKDGKIKEIKTEKVISENPKLSEIGKEIEKLGVFAEVVASYSGGKLQSARINEKTRLKK